MTMTATTVATERPTRPVHADPRYDDRDHCLPYAEQEPASAHWDLAWGCALSFGPAENGGPLRVSIHMSDREAAAGMCVREVTAEQVSDYAHHLLRLVGEETGPLECRTSHIGHHSPATVLVDGEPRCDSCADAIAPDDQSRRSPLPVSAEVA